MRFGCTKWVLTFYNKKEIIDFKFVGGIVELKKYSTLEDNESGKIYTLDQNVKKKMNAHIDI